ncbi:MAG: bifunctional tRNA (5-methylaminomethyl-2-thiouridine)(34)-methyltransferase MnmD/FAD-dependent 5-carboxymethylaminomethyl-2-thiouridine(34) oxidoreductase MnmC [Bdellovibrionota bacterium]
MSKYSKQHSINTAKLSWNENGDPVSERYGDLYFSKENGIEESEYVFFTLNNLVKRWQTEQDFTICELGFGTGLNFLLALEKWQTITNNSWLSFISIENEPLSKNDLDKALSKWVKLSKYKTELIKYYPLAIPGFHRILFPEFRTALTLCLGEASEQLVQLTAKVDAWFLDGFAPAKNPQIWTTEVYKEMARLSKPDATFGTFTSAGIVRRSLEDHGFKVTKCAGFGTKRESLQGVFKAETVNRSRKPWFSFNSLKPKKPYKVGIIGAGIAGTSVARALAIRGINLTLFESSPEIASGASGNPLALIHPYPMASRSQLGVFLEKGFLFAKQTLDYQTAKGYKIERHKLGGLQLRSSDRLKKVFSEMSSLDVLKDFCELSSNEKASELAGIEINEAAFYYTQAEAVNPKDVCHANLNDCLDRITIKTDVEISKLEQTNSGWEVVSSTGQKESFDLIVVCSSYLASKFQQLTNFSLTQIKGEVAFIPATPESSKLKTIVSAGGYLIPSLKGEHLIGASYDKENLDLDLSRDTQQELLDKISSRLPDLKLKIPENVSGRASIRGATFNKLPYVGPVPDYNFYSENYATLNSKLPAQYLDNLFISIGFGSRGFISAQLAGEQIACLICDQPLPLSIDIAEEIHPARALIRSFKLQSDSEVSNAPSAKARKASTV